jgi:hypothetical protein
MHDMIVDAVAYRNHHQAGHGLPGPAVRGPAMPSPA